MVDLNGKTALITGASRGIGRATAIGLAKHGANVVLAARSENEIEEVVEIIRAEGGNAVGIACDVSRYDDVAGAGLLCLDRFGGLDILVNNAGIIDPIARIADSDPVAWGAVVDVNVKGVYHGLRMAIPMMEAAGAGVIINLSSGAATGALEGWSHYCSTKAAVLSLTKCADRECRENGVHVIGLSPGTVATEMQVAIKESGINPVSQLDPSVHISPEWVAKAIAWLCSENGHPYAGTDFSLKTEENRILVGLV